MGLLVLSVLALLQLSIRLQRLSVVMSVMCVGVASLMRCSFELCVMVSDIVAVRVACEEVEASSMWCVLNSL